MHIAVELHWPLGRQVGMHENEFPLQLRALRLRLPSQGQRPGSNDENELFCSELQPGSCGTRKRQTESGAVGGKFGRASPAQ